MLDSSSNVFPTKTLMLRGKACYFLKYVLHVQISRKKTGKGRSYPGAYRTPKKERVIFRHGDSFSSVICYLFSIVLWELKGAPPMPSPPRNKDLLGGSSQ